MSEAAAALAELPLVTMLPPDVRALVLERFEPGSFSFGTVILREGDAADAFYVLVSGRARVFKRTESGVEVALGVLRPGDSFGEAALITKSVRTASVRASGNCEVLRLDRASFDELVAAHPEIRTFLELQVKQRSLVNFFRQHATFARLPPAVTLDLATRLEQVNVGAGELVI